MSFKFLNLRLGILALGLFAIFALLLILGANERVSAATPAAHCGISATGQDQACLTNATGVKKVKAEATTWVRPATASGSAVAGKELTKVAVVVTKTQEPELHASNHLAEALVLFAIALGGIAFLGRHRKVPTHRN